MIYSNIIQGSDEWKELRYRKIGGSSNEMVMANFDKPVYKNAIFYTLLGEFLEDFEIDFDTYLSRDVVRGNELEPEAREEFSRIYGKKVFEVGWSESSDFTGISPDGIIGDEDLIDTDERNVNEALEIKCPSKSTYCKYLDDNSIAINDYAWQIVTYFKEFPNLSVLNLFIYRPENNAKSHILIKITKDTRVFINSKKSGIVSDLVVDLTNRQNELKTALDNRIKELTTPVNEF